jgi:hypothetical protein
MAFVVGRIKECGFWMLAALARCVYYLVVGQLQWAGRAAQRLADRIKTGMIDGIGDSYGHVYPSGALEELKKRRRPSLGGDCSASP